MGFKKSLFLGLLVYIVSSYLMFILLAVKGLGYDTSDIFGSQFGPVFLGSLLISANGCPAIAVMLYYGYLIYYPGYVTAAVLLLLIYIIPNILTAIIVGVLSPSPKRSIIAVTIILGVSLVMNLILSFSGFTPITEFLLTTFVFTQPELIDAIGVISLSSGITNILVYGGVSVLFSKYQLKYRSKRKK